jgi:hypothetical protein
MSAGGFIDACGFIPASSGTGSFVVSTNVVGYQTPASAAAVNAAVYSYRAESADKSQWEEGFGAYTVSTTTLARTTITANSLGTTVAVSFTAAPNVFITALSADLENASLLNSGAIAGKLVSALLQGYLSGLTLSTAGSSATFGIASGVAADSTGVDMMSLASAITKTTSAFAAGSGNGALDTGAIAASTWYHAHEIKNETSGAVDVLVSLSATAPTLPSGFTIFRRIGAMKTDVSSHWTAFSQNGNEFLLSVPVVDIAVSANLSTTVATFTLASVPTGIKVNALGVMLLQTAAASTGILISSLDTAGATPAVNGIGYTAVNSETPMGGFTNIRTNTSGQFRALATSAADLSWTTMGWIDNLGGAIVSGATTVTPGQLPGTATNDNANAGNVGEYISSSVASGAAVALTSVTTANVTSISLPAGDWDVSAMGYFTGGASTTFNRGEISISTTSATENTTPGQVGSFPAGGATVFNNDPVYINVGPARLSLSATTTVYMVAQASFGTSTCSAYGLLRARRVR